ncbi:MAG: MFS transporter [Acidobacteria bacterium]|nr:MFS transporter [Acidobacteriota bacterium]
MVSQRLWQDRSSKVALYVGFAATGVALTIPGAVLPLLLRRWSMDDTRGGLLLFAFYAMGTVGSYCARGTMNFSVARGAVLTAVGALCVAWAGQWSAYAAIALYGAGLSLTMTSISLLLSQRFPAQRRLEMTRLNLIWAIGAALGPGIALRAAKGAVVTQASAILHAQHVLAAVAVFFVVAAMWAMWVERPGSVAAATSTSLRSMLQSGIREVPWPLLVLIFGATGVDAAAGGWLTSYAQRAGDSLGITIGAATFLWVGALLSRIVHSTPWAARWPERWVLGSSMITMSAALALLIAWPAGWVTMAAAALLGVAAGPVYPLLIAAALRHKENSTVFAIAGVGASMLPLATGAASTWTHSLRAGLGVPLAASVLMIGVVMVSGKWLRGRTTAATETLLS